MFDFEKLMVEIKSRLCLWNLDAKDYHDKIMKNLA